MRDLLELVWVWLSAPQHRACLTLSDALVTTVAPADALTTTVTPADALTTTVTVTDAKC